MTKGEKEMKKMAGAPLMMTDMTDIAPNIYYMIPSNINVGCDHGETEGGFNIGLTQVSYDVLGQFDGDSYGGYSYTDEYEYGTARQVDIYVSTGYWLCNIWIQEGEFIDITYDNGQTKRIYLPEVIGEELFFLYPSTTGETYYDSALTNDACTYGNGCISPSNALLISDLTNIDLLGLTIQSYGGSWQIFILIEGYLGTMPTPSLEETKGHIYLDDNNYIDWFGSTSTKTYVLLSPEDAPALDIREGDNIKLTYDGGQTIDVYFPTINTDAKIYVSNTGETYYDSALTNDACTYGNGCAGATVCNTDADGITGQSCDGCVHDTEFPTAVNDWKGSQTRISDSEFPTVVNKWKSQDGC